MPKKKYEEASSSSNDSRIWGKLMKVMDRWTISSQRKKSKALLSYLQDLNARMSCMCQEILLIEQSRLKDVERFLDVEYKKAEIACLKSQLAYLAALKKISVMHWALTEDGKKCDDNWMLEKLETHYVLKFKDSLKYIHYNECHLRSQLQDLHQTEYQQLEGEKKWIKVQKKAARDFKTSLLENQIVIRNVYQTREKELAFAISRVDDSRSTTQLLFNAHGYARSLLGDLEHYLGQETVTRMPKKKYEEASSSSNDSRIWGKLMKVMDRWTISSQRKKSKALLSYLQDLNARMSCMCQEILLIEQSRLKDVERFLDVEYKKAEIACLKSQLAYLAALKKISVMHWALTEDGKKCDDNWMLEKLETHYVLKFKDSLKYIHYNECHLRSQLQDLHQTEYQQLEGEKKWIKVQKKAARDFKTSLLENQIVIRNVYQTREKELAFAISRVDDSRSTTQLLFNAHGYARSLLGDLEHYLGQDHSGEEISQGSS